jgi:folate-binding protein YgfZ
MRVSELGPRLLIDLPAQTAEAVRQRLADFIFSEDVDVQDVSQAEAQLGIYGPASAGILASVLTRPLLSDDEAARRDRLDSMPLFANAEWQAGATPVWLVRSDDYGIGGFELFVQSGRRDDLRRDLIDAGAREVSAGTVSVTRIEAGRPEFGVDMDEHTIPLEAGIEERAISLTKGCYVGQEVIIRVLHRGQGRVARRLVGLIADAAGGPLASGQHLQRDGKDVGKITSAVESPRLKRPIALGYVHRESSEPGTVLQTGADGPETRSVTVVTVPFIQPASE